MKKKLPAAEITSFKLAGYSCKQFTAANADIDKWLTTQPGFQSRIIAQQANSSIIDILLWDSVHDGNRAMQRITIDMAHSKVHAMINHGTADWRCIPVAHQLRATA